MTSPDTLLPGLDFKSPAQVSALFWLQIYKSCCEKDMPSLVILQLCFGREESSSLMLVCLQHKPSTPDLLFFFFNYLFIFGWTGSSSVRGLSLVVEHGLLVVAASLVVGHRLWSLPASVVAVCGLSSCASRALEHRINSCGTQASLLQGMWNLPRPGIKPMSPTVAGKFLTTKQQGSPGTFFKEKASSLDWLDFSSIMVLSLCLSL